METGSSETGTSLGRSARWALAGVLLLTFDLYVWRISLLNDVLGAWLVLRALNPLPDAGGEFGVPTKRWWQGLLAVTAVTELAVLFGLIRIPVGAGPVVTQGNALGVLLQLLGLILGLVGLLALTRSFTAVVSDTSTVASWARSRQLLTWLYAPLIGATVFIGILWIAAGEELRIDVRDWTLLVLLPLAVAFLAAPLHVATSLWRTTKEVPTAGTWSAGRRPD